MFFQNVDGLLPNCTMLWPRRVYSLQSSAWEPQILVALLGTSMHLVRTKAYNYLCIDFTLPDSLLKIVYTLNIIRSFITSVRIHDTVFNYCKCTEKEERFRMVRTGRQETMNPSVKDISVFELAKRDAKSTAQTHECLESLELEVCRELFTPHCLYLFSIRYTSFFFKYKLQSHMSAVSIKWCYTWTHVVLCTISQWAVKDLCKDWSDATGIKYLIIPWFSLPWQF